SILQDQILGDGEATIARFGSRSTLDRLKREARDLNLEAGLGRIKSDFIEPETLVWEAWRVLPPRERAQIAHEIISGFLERVQQASAVDPRPGARTEDPMKWHRHRPMPVFWLALDTPEARLDPDDPVKRELEAWKNDREKLLGRRPVFSQTGTKPPWDAV
ncbi:MAG: hypothetical protein HY815_24870, partial [Candidatus Riflebacteria bacterium]|nr:hypothetical protein [Candidatus Riflebacteria bacterium]